MNISKLLGLSIAFNGAFIALASTNIYHTNWLGLVLGGAILLAGGYMVVQEGLD